jgi:segregation and condensation protein A
LTSMQDYRVDLDAYSGPLDLLLFLVRRDEIDLYNIPIARLTAQYLEHLKLMQQIDVNLAGEFLVMAATLLEIKSALLVPQAPAAETDEAAAATVLDSADPRYELVQQLLAYKRFKDAASDLEERRQTWQARYARTPPRPPRSAGAEPGDIDHDYVDGVDHADNAAQVELDLEDLSVVDLCEAFTRILETIGQAPLQHQVVYDDTPISLHAEDILDRLTREGNLSLQKIFEGRGRSEAIGLFLAMLELVRQAKVRVIQEPASELIQLELAPAGAAATEPIGPAGGASRWVNPQTGQVEYEWPNEETRLRAERRAKLRASRAAKGQFGKTTAGEDEDEIIDVDGEPDEVPRKILDSGTAAPTGGVAGGIPDQPLDETDAPVGDNPVSGAG